MTDFMITFRKVKKKGKEKSFADEMGPAQYLTVSHDSEATADHCCTRKEWLAALCNEEGPLIALIHGDQRNTETSLQTQRYLSKQLQSLGYKGSIVGIDWVAPVGPIHNWDDRDAAHECARRLRDDCLAVICSQQQKNCERNIHILAHGSGAYLLREAFTLADEKRALKNLCWGVDHIALVAADISSRSMRGNSDKAAALYRHCHGVTNYQNPYDESLSLSHSSQHDISERVGRVGLPHNECDRKAININCQEQFLVLEADSTHDNPLNSQSFSHEWYFSNRVFLTDFLHSIDGKIDRHAIPTRQSINGAYVLCDPESILLLEE